MAERVAVMGLGAMGARMAERLLEGGYDVVVTNRTRERGSALVERGARWAPSPKEAVADADIALCMVRDDEAARGVWLDPDRGALAGLKKGALAIESSTLSLPCVSELAQEVGAAGVSFLDAPVVGSRPHAENGQLIFLVGGDREAAERAGPFFETLGSRWLALGPNGSGAAMKLCINALFAIQVGALGEALGLANKAGISTKLALETLLAMPTASPALVGIGKQIEEGSYEPLFPIELVLKDLDYAREAGTRSDAALPMADSAHAVFREAAAKGLGDRNIAAAALVFSS